MDALAYSPRRWTRSEYERLAEQGFFRPDERLELLDGEIITVTPQRGQHAKAVGLVQEALQSACQGQGVHVRVQLPLALGPFSEPEPDVSVVRGSFRDYDDHPSTAELVVEVADTSLRLDRQKKGPLYAGAGIPEYWIVNLVDGLLEVYRDPIEVADGWTYRLIQRLGPGETVSPLVAPTAVMSVAEVLP